MYGGYSGMNSMGSSYGGLSGLGSMGGYSTLGRNLSNFNDYLGNTPGADPQNPK
jgi:hypothetical protein